MPYVSNHRAVLGDLYTNYTSGANGPPSTGPNGWHMAPNGDIVVNDADGNEDHSVPHPGSGTFNDVDAKGVSEAQKAALFVKMGGPIQELALANTVGIDAKGQPTATFDPTKAAAIQAIADTDPWVQAAHAQSMSGNAPSAAQQSIAAAVTRQDFIGQAVTALQGVEAIDRGEVFDVVAYVNNFLKTNFGAPPLTADEVKALNVSSSMPTYTPGTPAGPPAAPPPQTATSTGTTSAPAAPSQGPSASANYPVVTTSAAPSDANPGAIAPPSVGVDVGPAPASSRKLLWLAGGVGLIAFVAHHQSTTRRS